MSYSTLFTELSDGILTITINRPDKLNALNRDVLADLDRAITDLLANDEVHAAIITGSGTKAFVAGADISEFLQYSREGGSSLAKKGQDIFQRIEDAHKPIVAAVNGFALGGGCELAMACHFRLASENAKFGQPEVNLGLIPGYGGTQRLTRLVGRGKATELMMTGHLVDAAEAKTLGLVNHVTTQDTLLEHTRQILSVILTKSPLALGKIIAAVNASFDPTVDGMAEEARLFGDCFGTPDMTEGVTAFLEKRKPDFRKR